MDDADRVRRGEPAEEVLPDRDHVVVGHPPLLLQEPAHRAAVEQLEADVGHAILGLARVEDLDDRGVADLRHALGLAEEAGHGVVVRDELLVHHLHRHALVRTCDAS